MAEKGEFSPQTAAKPTMDPKEATRLAVLEKLQILDTAPEQEYDDLTQLAAFICGTPVSLISLVDENRQFFKSAHNLGATETPREQSFCAHAIDLRQTLVVPDARQDARFATNPLVIGDPNIRFYAGAPIFIEGEVLGALCVIDREPRQLLQAQQLALEALARQASNLLDARLLALHNRHLQQEAEGARRRLQDALDAIGLAAWFYDPKRAVVGGDKRMAQFFGLEIQEGPVDLWLASIVDEDRARVGQKFSASLEGTPYDTKYRVLVRGEVRWLHSRASINPLPDGGVQMVGVCEDVTREEALAVKLDRAQSRLAVAQEASGAVSFDWNVDEDRLIWNSDFVLGRPASEFSAPGEYLAQVHAEDRAALQEAVTLALQEGRGYYIEFRLYWPDGSVRWVSSSAKPLRNAQGRYDSLLGVNLDITDRRQSEEALLRSEKLAAVGRLASVISHEINNPLEAVTNLLYIVRMGANLSQQDRDNLELADRELARVSQIAAQTLRFHRNLNRPGQIEASTIVHEMLTLYHSRLLAAQIQVKLDLREGVEFEAFEGDIRQVLNNLIGNAFDAMRRGGRLTIRTRFSAEAKTGRRGASITVSDSGPGIPEGVREHIFQAFYSTKGINGTGLGLWISKRIIHKHRGHLRFRTRVGEGHGTAFRLWVPLKIAQTAAEPWL